MLITFLKCFTLFSYFIVRVTSTYDEPEITFEQLYQFGKNEYTMGNWGDCIAFFLRALEDYKLFVDENVWCREMCSRQRSVYRLADLKDEDDDIKETAEMYANAQHSLCLLRCKNDRLTPMRPNLKNPDIFEEFQKRKPYQYLQICYWKQKDLASAVRSSYTYLVANVKDQETLNNLAFYMEQDGYDENMLIDALQMGYEASYMKGVKMYQAGDWQLCVNEFENSLRQLFDEEKRCRFMCDDKLNWETMDTFNPELSVIITSLYTSVIRCKNDCIKKLSRVNGHDIGSILPTFFEHLHICYFKLNRGRDACQATANSILLDPSNTVMRRNKLFYSKVYGKQELFLPSETIIKFHRRNEIERAYLGFVDDKFKLQNNEYPSEHLDDRKPLDLSVHIDDDFDYLMIEKKIVDQAECSALNIAAIFEVRTPQQKQLIAEITERVAEQYSTRATFHSLSCSDEKNIFECAKHSISLSIDRSTCGNVTSEFGDSSCSIIFCTG